MTWDDVRKSYKSQWVLLEAITSSTQGDNRIVEQMEVVGSFGEDSDAGFQRYIELHKVHNDREYYIYHTSNEKLDIGVKKWMGVRV